MSINTAVSDRVQPIRIEREEALNALILPA
jgi:hypothetical protein